MSTAERLAEVLPDAVVTHVAVSRSGKRVVTLGSWTPPPGGFAGGKIAYTRIPDAEDFL